MSAVLVVTDVPVFPSSVVTEFCGDVSLDPDWEFDEPQSFPFSKKRPFSEKVSQETMRYEGSSVKAPPLTRRRMMPSTPQQNSNSSYDKLQWQTEMEVEGSSWSSCERKVIAKIEAYLNKHDNVKVEVEELKLMVGPEDSEVNLRKISMNASKSGRKCFEILSTKERNEH